MSKKVVFTFHPASKGGTTVEAQGFNGKGCQAAVKQLLQRMKAQEVSEPDYSPEFYATEIETEKETG